MHGALAGARFILQDQHRRWFEFLPHVPVWRIRRVGQTRHTSRKPLPHPQTRDVRSIAFEGISQQYHDLVAGSCSPKGGTGVVRRGPLTGDGPGGRRIWAAVPDFSTAAVQRQGVSVGRVQPPARRHWTWLQAAKLSNGPMNRCYVLTRASSATSRSFLGAPEEAL